MSTLFDCFPPELKKRVIDARLAKSKPKQYKNKTLKSNINMPNTKDYAFIRAKKLPLETPRNVTSAITHFLNVKNVTNEEREIAFKKILKTAESHKICTMGFIKQYERYKLNCSSGSKN